MAFVREKTKSKYWHAVFTDESGRRREKSTKQTDRRKAQFIADEWENAAAKARKGELTQATILGELERMMERTTGETLGFKTTVREFFDDYLNTRKSLGRAQASIARYKSIVRSFMEVYGEERADKSLLGITPTDIQLFRDKQIEEGKSPTTVNQSINIVKAILNRACDHDLILKNPANRIERLDSTSERRETFSKQQIQSLLSSADDEWRGMVLLGYHTGIRISDASMLIWENVNLDARTLSFVQTKISRRGAKGKEPIVLPLHEDLMNWFRERPRGIGKAPVFPGLFGKGTAGYNCLTEQFRKLCERAGIKPSYGELKKGKGRRFNKLTFHSLRHTFISNLADLEVSPDVRKEMAGHSSDKTHSRYTHLSFVAKEDAIKKVPSVI